MADFHQTGAVTTLHDLRTRKPGELQAELERITQSQRITLVLPSLFSELEGDALPAILDELEDVKWLNHIVIGLDRANEEEYRYARQFFSRLPQNHSVLWNDGPRLKAIDERLAGAGLSPKELGKGRNVWYCFGYTLAMRNSQVVALHDCDILTYSSDMLAKLVYPLAAPGFPYKFSKGFYPRTAEGKLNGRVNRLLVTPLLLALRKTIGPHPYVDYLRGFRYPLAGEFALRTSALPEMRIPSDWGLEIGVLSEAWRNLSHRAVCQVELADNYDHKHQPLSAEDASQGLSRMSTDICKAIFSKMAIDGVVFSNATFRALKASYYRTALDMIDTYFMDASLNGLHVDRHKEEMAVELFAANLVEAGTTFLDKPMDAPFIPNWSRVQSADPALLDDLYEAVRLDEREFG